MTNTDFMWNRREQASRKQEQAWPDRRRQEQWTGMEDAWNAPVPRAIAYDGGMTQPDPQAPNVFQLPNMPTPRAPQDSAGSQPSAPLSAQQSDPKVQPSTPMGSQTTPEATPQAPANIPWGTPESDRFSMPHASQQSTSAPLAASTTSVFAPQAPIGAPEFTYNPTSPSMQAESIPSTGPMVFAVLGLFLIGLFGTIPAWVWSNTAIKRARAAQIPESAYQQALIARTLGIIGTVIHICLAGYLIYYAVTTISAAVG